jgi:CRISPR-associated endonuclease Csn1
MDYRLGIDLGTNSLGWFAVKLGPDGAACAVLDGGVRILTPNAEAGRDPQKKQSLAADRRAARATRRRRDRFVRRQQRLMETLVAADLMPADPTERKALERLDPYWLRAAALDQRLEPHELGRAIFHLNQRRGFKSNRIADAGDKEKSATKEGVRALEAALHASNARTLGEFLAQRHKRDRHARRLSDGAGFAAPQPVRFRPRAEGASNLYDFYPTREMVAHELEAIWAAQGPHHPQLTPALLAKLERIIIEQRKLEPPPVGLCTLMPEAPEIEEHGLRIKLGQRTPKAHPLFQRFRILQDAAHLRISRPGVEARRLTMQEFHAVAAKLMAAGESRVSFDGLRKGLKLPEDASFNYEFSGREGFPPDQTAVKLSNGKAFGRAWRSFSRERQIEIVERLLATQDAGALQDWLQERCGLSTEQAEFVSEVRLPQGHGQFGRAALAALVDVMEREMHADPVTGELVDAPMTYDEAVRRLEAGLHHSDHRPDPKNRLPYYGGVMRRHVIANPDAPPGSQENIGRVPNPTVHIGLNQLRAVVNALIDACGPPKEIVVELARELKLNQSQKEKIQKENQENEKKNQDRRDRLARCGVSDTYNSRLMLRLFDELPAAEKVCVYSGDPLSMNGLFDGSIEIDHILPQATTLDDSPANKVLCTREANRIKGKRTAAEAWSGDALQTIVERAQRLFPKKAWRFQPDAMKQFLGRGDLADRYLRDTQHMARLAKEYLEHVCPHVWASKGLLTAMLRGKWGLNGLLPDDFAETSQPKNRNDHRHHAIDAFVLACTNPGMINRIARASGEARDLNLDRLFPKGGFPEPFEGFREALDKKLKAMVVSHKPDHGIAPGRHRAGATSGKLHQATAYGLVNRAINGKRYNLVTREAITALTNKKIERVADDRLRSELQRVSQEAAQSARKLSEALADFGRTRGIRRVRVLKTKKPVEVVTHGAGFKKGYLPGDNHLLEIFELPDGSWSGEVVTEFEANNPAHRVSWRSEHPNAVLVMRLHKSDLIEADFGEGHRIFRVYQLEPSARRVRLSPHNMAGNADERTSSNDPLRRRFGVYSNLKKAGARRVRVDAIGRVSPAVDT